MRKVLWKELGNGINGAPFFKKMQYSRILHKQWPTMKRYCVWKYSETDLCPLCSKHVEDRNHVFLCKDELAVTYRDQALIELKKDLLKIHTDHFLTNHIIRILRQYHSEFPVTEIQLRDDAGKFERCRAKLLNMVIDSGANNLLSGVITSDLSEIQQYHIDDHELSSVTHISKWNRSFIQLILNYTNDLWLYRCSILHSQKNLQRDTLIRNQAISLLQKLRRDPFQLPHASRDLAHRSCSKMMTADLSSVRNWIAHVSVALDLQA